MQLPELKLPPFDAKIQLIDGARHIWDPIRKEYYVLTPEEWVRQHFINLLIHHLGYPKALFKIERSHHYNKRQKRSDMEVWRSDGSIFMLIECKAPNIAISEEVVKQASEYNKVLQADYLAVSNGLKHHIWSYDKEHQHYVVLSQFPLYV